MKKAKKIICYILTFTILFIVGVAFLFQNHINAYADTDYEDEMNYGMASPQDAQPYGLYTSLSISINGGNNNVWVTVKNDLTIFPSTVYVIVQLYSSDTYCEDYNKMALAASNSTLDLDMGKSIVAKANTEGQQQYWIGRMRYRVDTGSWKEKTVGPALYDANGNFVGIL